MTKKEKFILVQVDVISSAANAHSSHHFLERNVFYDVTTIKKNAIKKKNVRFHKTQAVQSFIHQLSRFLFPLQFWSLANCDRIHNLGHF